MGSRWVSGLAVFLLVLHSTLLVTQAATKIVGGSQGWRYGFNYTAWARDNAPFYVNDTLVFRYDLPNGTSFPHSVSLMKNRTNFIGCSFDRANLVASVAEGGNSGFKFVLRKRKKPYYFACGEHGGLHCSAGLMKFSVFPLPRPTMA